MNAWVIKNWEAMCCWCFMLTIFLLSITTSLSDNKSFSFLVIPIFIWALPGFVILIMRVKKFITKN